MDLKLKDVADLLNVSETTIRRWVQENQIPHYRLNQELRFSRNEIEPWVFSCTQGKESISPFHSEEGTEHLGTQQFGFYRALYRGDLYLGVEGKTKETLVRASVQHIASHLRLDAEMVSELLLDRERLMPTALSHGIAVPHTRDFLLKGSFDAVAVVFPKEPIEYGALDGKPVHTLFFLFACDDRRHLHLLAKIAHFCSDAAHLAFLQGRPRREVLLEYVKRWEATIRPPHLRVSSPSVVPAIA